MTAPIQLVPKAKLPDWAEHFQRLGLRTFLFERSGNPESDWKKAIGKRWNDRKAVDDLSKYDPERHNVGTITGCEIAPGRFLADVDLDWSPPRELTALLPASDFIFGRPSKPISHLFLATPERLPSVKEYKDIDGTKFLELFGGDFSQYTMVPPSLRSPNEPLTFYSERKSAITPISSEDLYRQLRNYAIAVVLYRNLGPRGVLHDIRYPLAGFLLKEGLPADDVRLIGETLTGATGNDKDDWNTAFYSTQKLVKAGETRNIAGRTKLVEQLGDIGKKLVARIKQFIGNSEFIVNEHGKVVADSTDNIRTAIEKLDVRLMFDEFSEQLLCQRGSEPPTLLDDSIRITLRFDIEQLFRFRPSNELYKEVLADSAYRNRIHPVREYLQTQKWDGKPRIDTWLIEYGGAKDTTFIRSISAKVLIAAVRRIMTPGCKFDEMLIFESKQGLNKSSAIQALCPNADWFSDSLPLGADAQKVVEQTGGKWIIEASELHGHRGKEVEAIKAFLSRAVDGPVRLAYAHFATHRKRQFILIGTTNLMTGYLKDSTGARRFWPVRVGNFDVEALRRDRNQLWAEAAEREARGESIRLEPELWATAGIEQEERQRYEPWQDTIEELLVNDPAAVPTEIIWLALGKHGCNFRSPADGARVDEIMQKLGYPSRRKVYLRNPDTGTKERKRSWVKADVEENASIDWDAELLQLIPQVERMMPEEGGRAEGGPERTDGKGR